MSSTRSTRSRASEVEINELVSRLHALLPELHQKCTRGSASGIVKEACNYIRRLRREVEDLSQRLTDLLQTLDPASAEADIIRSLIL